MRKRAVLTGGVTAVALVIAAAVATGPAGAQDPPPPAPPPAVDQGTTVDQPSPTTRPLPPLAAGEHRVAVSFEGGHDTDPRDHGRPVVLVAAALAVPADVFRQTFTHVRPAGAGQGGPTEDEARKNKAALMAGLSKYGVTNDRLDAVSNYYRYVRGRDGLWRHRPAVAYAVVRDGAVVRFDIVDPGAGYTTPPQATVEQLADGTVDVGVTFGTDLATNGSVFTLTLDKGR